MLFTFCFVLVAAQQGLAANYPDNLYRLLSQDIGLTDEDKTFILNYHNTYRSLVANGKGYKNNAITAANMNALLWHEGLAQTAQKHASDCSGPSHDAEDNRKPPNSPFLTVGQNLMDCSQTGECLASAMAFFVVEGKGFDYSMVGVGQYCDASKTASKTCGHYLQLTWATSAFVGCAYDRCTNKGPYARLVCNYAEAGVYKDVVPFISGSVCSQCEKYRGFCLRGICLGDTAKQLITDASLQREITCSISQSQCAANGGTFVATSCLCQCPSGRSGRLCEKSCSDSLPDGLCAAYAAYCEAYADWSKINCAQTCGYCDEKPQVIDFEKNFVVDPRAVTSLPELDGTIYECRVGNGATYKGKQNFGLGGVVCKNWKDSPKYSAKYPNLEANYCRNPDGSAYPWCPYDNNAGFVYCEVRPCAST